MTLARRAERAGFAGAWMVEYEYDTFAFCQAIATSTERLVTGSCIARTFTRHPLLVAETASVIDRLAPGRFAIGLGTGGVREREGRTASAGSRELALQRWGQPSDRAVARMREYIEVIRLALTGETVSYAGSFFEFDDFQLGLLPTGEIPIYIAAGGDQLRRLGGRTADGVFLWLVARDEARHAVATVKRAAEQAGRDPDAVKVAVLVPSCVADDGAAARSALRGYLVEYYLGASAYQHVLPRSGFPGAAEEIRGRLARGDLAGAAEALPEEALDEIAIAGTPSESRRRFAEFVASRGLDFAILYVFPAGGDWAEGYRAAIDAFRSA